MLLRGVERALEVVEHGQELGDQALAGTQRETLLLAQGALPVVVEVGGQPPEVGEVLVPLRLRVGQTGGEVLRTSPPSSSTSSSRRVQDLVRHDVFAASSSSITS